MTVFEMNNALSDVYAMYLRKSQSDRDDESIEETLSRHKKILTELAARKGLFVGEIYQEVVSGSTISARPEIQKLIQACYDGKYKGIIIVEVTRLSRGNQGDAQIILDALKYGNRNNGVLVITPTKVYDIAHNSDDEEYMEFELFMSRREYKMITRRMDRGRQQAVVEGQYMGAYRPYGWNIVKARDYRTLEPHETEFKIGQLMYEWRIKEKLTPYKIAQRLTAMGIPTYTGGGEWSKETVKDFLRNPVNMGKVRWNDRMQIKTMVDGELVTSRPRSNHTEHYMLYEGMHMKHAMVDEETFKAANAGFKTDKTKANLKLANPLAGLFVCEKCGKVMQYASYKHRKTYTPPRYNHPQSSICKVKSVVESDVINALSHSLKLYIDDFEVKVDGMPDVDENSIATQIEALRAEMRKVEKKLAKTFDDYEDGIYTANEFVQRKAVHNEKIDSIKKQISVLENTIPEKIEYEDRILMLSDALSALNNDTLDADIKNRYLKEIIDRIDYSRENNGEFVLDIQFK